MKRTHDSSNFANQNEAYKCLTISPPEMFCSGDFDSVCSLLATRYSVNDLNLTITTKWYPWYTPDSEVIKEGLE